MGRSELNAYLQGPSPRDLDSVRREDRRQFEPSEQQLTAEQVRSAQVEYGEEDDDECDYGGGVCELLESADEGSGVEVMDDDDNR